MIFDALDPTVSLDRSVDIVIVGSGPAGITLARKLSRLYNILLLEAGGLDATTTSTNCLAGEISGLHYPITETRARQFGGSTALWAGYCARFDPIDFVSRPWVAKSGWPFPASELTQHYKAAAEALHVNDACFDPSLFGVALEESTLQPDIECFEPCLWRFGEPTADFAKEHRKYLDQTKSINVLINTCATNIHLTPNGESTTHLDVRTISGRSGVIHAKVFILASGGIETARLLLASKQQQSTGVGNAQGHVGRWFMEHPHISIEGIEVNPHPELATWTGVTQTKDRRKFTRCTGLRPELQTQKKILNAKAHFYRTPDMAENSAPKVGMFFEQAPNSNSRLTLTNKLDAVGLPRIRLHWELSELDRYSHQSLGELLAAALLHTGAAIRTGAISVSNEVLHSNHQLGTTKMSLHPSDGVVDPNCKVHGISNLYISGGSVFPTVSWANPTLTVLALSIRLSEHLLRKLGNEDINDQSKVSIKTKVLQESNSAK